MAEQLPIPKFEYTPEQQAEFAASDAEQALQPTQQAQTIELLQGPRQTGDIPLPNGGFERHGISGDGMKYSRIHGEKYKSAADFHRQAGVAQDYELENQPEQNQSTRRLRAGKALGRFLGIKR